MELIKTCSPCNSKFTLQLNNMAGISPTPLPFIQPTFHHLCYSSLSLTSSIASFSCSRRICPLSSVISVAESPLCRLQKVIMNKHEATGKKEQLKWTESMDDTFIQSMITQKDKGNRINDTFTSQAYTNMVEELRTKHQMEFTKNHLKNRLKKLKASFSQWYDVFRGTSLSGFSWNSNTQLIEAEDEVWNSLIVSKPDVATRKMRKVSNYNEMLELFTKDRASGVQATTAKERNAQMQANDSINIENVPEFDKFLAANDVTMESQYNTDDDVREVNPTSSLPEQSSSSKKYKSRKRKVEQQDEDLASTIMNGVGSMAIAILEGNKIIQEGNKIIQEGNKILNRAYQREYKGEEIYNELKSMGLESYEIPRALNFLVANQT